MATRKIVLWNGHRNLARMMPQIRDAANYNTAQLEDILLACWADGETSFANANGIDADWRWVTGLSRAGDLCRSLRPQAAPAGRFVATQPYSGSLVRAIPTDSPSLAVTMNRPDPVEESFREGYVFNPKTGYWVKVA